MGRRRGRDWEAIQAAYIAGVTPAELERQHGIPAATIRSKASRGKWGVDRSAVAAEVQQQLPSAVASVVADVAAMVEAHFGIWQLVADRAREMLGESQPVVDRSGAVVLVPDAEGVARPLLRRTVDRPSHLRDLAQAFKVAVEGQRQARGLADPRPDAPAGPGGKPGDQSAGVLELPMLEPPPVHPDDEVATDDDPPDA